MNARIAALAFAGLTGACTTQSVDDTVRVSFDLLLSDIDVTCTPNITDSEDPESGERLGGFVRPSDVADGCYVAGYYRGPILDFDDFAAELPDGVDELTWTDVTVDLVSFDVDVEGLERVPFGDYYFVGAVAGTEADIGTYEVEGFDDPLNNEDPAARVVVDTSLADPPAANTLVGWSERVSSAIAIDELTAQLVDTPVESGDSADLAQLFNDAYASDADALYVFAGSYFNFETRTLPKMPSDIEVEVTLDIDYAANAKVDLLKAAQGN